MRVFSCNPEFPYYCLLAIAFFIFLTSAALH
jgi:hypothetical protein